MEEKVRFELMVDHIVAGAAKDKEHKVREEMAIRGKGMYEELKKVYDANLNITFLTFAFFKLQNKLLMQMNKRSAE